MPANILQLRRFVEWLFRVTSINKPASIFFMLLGSPAIPFIPFAIAKGDNLTDLVQYFLFRSSPKIAAS